MTLNLYILGFAIGQLVYGPLADSYGRKPVIVLGTLILPARRQPVRCRNPLTS